MPGADVYIGEQWTRQPKRTCPSATDNVMESQSVEIPTRAVIQDLYSDPVSP